MVQLGMDKIDARKLNQDAQQEKRRMVVELRKKGISNRETAAIVGISECHASTLWSKYKRSGLGALEKKKRGRKAGQCKVLTPSQEKEIIKIITDKTPEQLKFKFALWTRKAVQELIQRHYGFEVPLRTLTDYLKRWGFTCQKPAKQAYEQQPAAVQKWLDEEYPKIEKQARTEKAEIYWGDETGMENNDYQAKGFAPKGKTPVVRLNAKRSRINMISAISNRGTLRFMFHKQNMDSDLLIVFMKRLVRDNPKKVYLILDNLRVHHSKKVKAWIEENSDSIAVFYLPSYSPELNPDEYLNGDLKRHIRSGRPARNEKELETKARGYLMKIRRTRDHIRGYFRHKHVKYAC